MQKPINYFMSFLNMFHIISFFFSGSKKNYCIRAQEVHQTEIVVQCRETQAPRMRRAKKGNEKEKRKQEGYHLNKPKAIKRTATRFQFNHHMKNILVQENKLHQKV